MKEADKLLDPDIYENVGQLRLLPFVNVLKAINKVVECCFSKKLIDTDVDSRTAELDRELKATPEISITLKLHVLLKHTKQCLETLKDEVWVFGLSRQASLFTNYFYCIGINIKLM